MIELICNFFDEMEADSRRFLETPPVFKITVSGFPHKTSSGCLTLITRVKTGGVSKNLRESASISSKKLQISSIIRMIELICNFFDEMEADSRRFLETPPVFTRVIRVKHPLDVL